MSVLHVGVVVLLIRPWNVGSLASTVAYELSKILLSIARMAGHFCFEYL